MPVSGTWPVPAWPGSGVAAAVLAEHAHRAVAAQEVQILLPGRPERRLRVIAAAQHRAARAGRSPHVPVDLQLDRLDRRRSIGRAGQRPDQLRRHLGQRRRVGRGLGQAQIDHGGLAPGQDLHRMARHRRGRRRERGQHRSPQPARRADQQGPHQIGGRVRGIDGHEDGVGDQVPALAGRVQVIEVAGLVGQLEQVLGEQELAGGLVHATGGQRGDPPLPVHPLQGELLVQQRPAAFRRDVLPAGADLAQLLRGDLDHGCVLRPERPPGGQDRGRLRDHGDRGPRARLPRPAGGPGQVLAGDRVVIAEIGAGQEEVLDYLRRGPAGGRCAHDQPAAERALLLAAAARGQRRVLQKPAGRHVGTSRRQGRAGQRGGEPAKQPPCFSH